MRTGYKKFSKLRRIVADRMISSISPSGRIGFNSLLYDKHLRQFSHAELFFNPDEKGIFIKFFKKPALDRYKVYPIRKGVGAYVNCKSFFKFYDCLPEKTARFEVLWSEEDQGLYILPDNSLG